MNDAFTLNECVQCSISYFLQGSAKVLIHSSENDVLVDEQFFGDAKLANQKQAQVGSSYKGTMWSVMTMLIILLCVVSVLLFLVWRHFK